MKEKEYLVVIWSNNTSLPTARELGLGTSNRYKDYTYRVKLESVKYHSDKKEDIEKYKALQNKIYENILKTF